jgi:hypothetical protein
LVSVSSRCVTAALAAVWPLGRSRQAARRSAKEAKLVIVISFWQAT